MNGKLHYWEVWEENDQTGVIHWGEVGTKGSVERVKSGLFSSFRRKLQLEAQEQLDDGYAEFDSEEMYFLEIEYAIDGFGTDQDLAKRHRLEERMQQTLGWTGLGDCHGGSIGNGSMEVGCTVVDYELAKTVIAKDVQGTEFENYSRIFQMK
nr:hypothetical protein [Allomuricauda sp.]